MPQLSEEPSVATGAGEGILDIVDLTAMEHATAEEQLARFQETWGCPPRAVALPVLAPWGVAFENDIIKPAKLIKYKGVAGPISFGEVVYRFAKADPSLDLYLTVSPSMGFVRSDSLHILDIQGNSASHACLCKQATSRLLVALTNDAIDKATQACRDASGSVERLRGVAFDLVNLWPMGAKNNRIVLTCFCRECREQLRALAPRRARLVQEFERFPNPWNLLLRDAGGGISPISNVSFEATAPAICDLSRLHGFDKPLVDASLDINKEAEVLHDYMHARHDQVVKRMKALFHEIPGKGYGGKGLKRILIVEGDNYGWSTGTFFEKLDDASLCDELWYDSGDSYLPTRHVQSRAYMWRRSRYFLDAFFEFLCESQDEEKRTVTGLARLPNQALKDLLEQRRRQAMAAGLSSTLDLFCLPELSTTRGQGRVGFVGANLSDELSRKLVASAQLVDASPGLVRNTDELGENGTMSHQQMRDLLIRMMRLGER